MRGKKGKATTSQTLKGLVELVLTTYFTIRVGADLYFCDRSDNTAKVEYRKNDQVEFTPDGNYANDFGTVKIRNQPRATNVKLLKRENIKISCKPEEVHANGTNLFVPVNIEREAGQLTEVSLFINDSSTPVEKGNLMGTGRIDLKWAHGGASECAIKVVVHNVLPKPITFYWRKPQPPVCNFLRIDEGPANADGWIPIHIVTMTDAGPRAQVVPTTIVRIAAADVVETRIMGDPSKAEIGNRRLFTSTDKGVLDIEVRKNGQVGEVSYWLEVIPPQTFRKPMLLPADPAMAPPPATPVAKTVRYTPFGPTDGERSVELEGLDNRDHGEATFKVISDVPVIVTTTNGATTLGGPDTLIELAKSPGGLERVRIAIAAAGIQKAEIKFGLVESSFVTNTPLVIERVAPASPPPPAKKPTFVKAITREVGADFVVITFVTCESSNNGAALLAGNVRVDSTARVTVTDDDTTAVIASTCYSTLVPTNAGTCERNVRFTLPTGIDAAEIWYQPEGFNQTSEPIKLERKAPAAPAAPAEIKFALSAPNADGIYSLDVEYAPSADMTLTRQNIEWSDTGNPTGTWNAATLPFTTDATGKKRVFVRTVKSPGDAILQIQSGTKVSKKDAHIIRR